MTVATTGQQSELSEDSRDIADIWREALKTYKGIVGFDLTQKFSSTADMINVGTQEMNKFHKFRHNEKKVDKLRTLFAANLDFVEAGAQQLIAAATPAFPPAAAIGTAVTFMLQACRQQSADYDVVVVFFEDMNSFLQRIVILETRMPKYRAFQNCLMDVFTAFLTMTAFAHKYIDLGRFKKWIQNLMFGQDEDLGGARKSMDTQLARFQSATEFAILANTEESKRMEAELLANQRSHGQLLEEQREVLGSLQETTDQIHSGVVKLIEAFQEQKRLQLDQRGEGQGRGAKESRGKMGGADKPPSANKIRKLLIEVEGEIHEYHILEETRVEDTCSWVFSEEQWKDWADLEAEIDDVGQPKKDETPDVDYRQRFLAIVGEPGVGKSHIAATAYDRLWKQASEHPDKHTCVAHFYFREQHQSLSSFLSAMTTVVNQVAEQSATLCEVITASYRPDDVSLNIGHWRDLVHVLLGGAFRKGSKHQLLLVLDGIDEMDNFDEYITFLKILRTQELRISVVFTTRPDVLSRITAVEGGIGESIPEILVTKDKQTSDMKTLVWDRINSLGNLRTFGRYVQQRIADKTEEVSPHMLYAETVLVRFDNLAREGAVLRSLDRPLPPTLHELYEESLTSVNRLIEPSHQDLLRLMLHLTAFSFRALQLHEVISLLKFVTGREDFEIDEVLQPLSTFIRVGDPGADAEARAKLAAGEGAWQTAVQDLEKSGKDDASRVYSDAALQVKFRERSMRNFFQGSLRGPNEHNGAESLRWTPSEAHRRLFLITAKLATPSKLDDKLKLGASFKKYSTHYCLQHFTKIVPAEHTSAEKVEVLNAAWGIFTNQHNFASMVEWNKSKYSDIFRDQYYQIIPTWADVAKAESADINEDVAKWWEELGQNPRSLFLLLGKVHLERLYRADDFQMALTRLRALKNAIEVSNSSQLIKQNALGSFPAVWNDMEGYEDDSDTDEDDVEDQDEGETGARDVDTPDVNADKEDAQGDDSEDESVSLTDRNIVLGILGLFDVNPTSGGHRVVAELLFKSGHREPAEITCKKALDGIEQGTSTTPLDKFKALLLMAQIQSKRGKRLRARELVAQYAVPEYLENETIPAAIKQAALVTKARIEAKNDDIESAYQAYSDAKLADPSKLTPGHILDEEISLFSEFEDVESYFKTLKRWTSLERLTWLAWDFDYSQPERRDILIDNAAKVGELDFVVEMYEEGIKYLDNVEAGAPLRVALSRVFFQGCKDLERAKRVLDEVLDSGSTGWPYAVTDEQPDETLEKAIDCLTYVIYEMFRQSKDPVQKQKLLDEVIGLTSRPLALDVPPISDTHMLSHRLMTNRMIRKMGHSAQYQKRMVEDIGVCMAGLSDKVGWNDGANLSALAAALQILSTGIPPCPEQSELQFLAGVFASARFNRLTKEHDDEDDESEEDESEDEDYSDDDESDEEEVEDDKDNNNQSDGDGDDADDYDPDADSERPSDEGDLLKDRVGEWICDGVCRPNKIYRWWGKRVVYECYTCGYFICEECHDGLTTLEAAPGRKFCSRDHELVKLPIKGWKGVKDGKVILEGHQDGGLEFDKLLIKVKDELCKKAWDIFWEGA